MSKVVRGRFLLKNNVFLEDKTLVEALSLFFSGFRWDLKPLYSLRGPLGGFVQAWLQRT